MDQLFCTKNLSLSNILHNIGDAVCVINNNSLIYVAVNQRYADFYRLKAEHLLGRYVFDIYPDFKNSVFFEAAHHSMTTGEPAVRIGYSNISNKSMVVRTFRFDDNHSVMCIHNLNTNHDKRCYVNHYDSLTSLYNRYAFEEDLELATLAKKSFSITILDLNKFKQINESFSYEVGDMCLMETAARLKQLLSQYKVYKFGSDQFAVIITDTKINCLSKSKEIFNVFKNPFTINGEQFNLTCSIGFNYITNFNQTEAEEVSNTEFALAKAKKMPNVLVEYDENSTRNTHKLQMVNDLKKAIKNKELEIFYQPQIDTITHKVCGAEALIRWRHPEKGLIPPNLFLDVAEEFHLIEDIDQFGLFRAMSDIMGFIKSGINMPISVNFSAKTICDPLIVPIVKSCLEKTLIDPSLLTIEITETSLMEDLSKSKDVIQQLSALGVNIALDDFGTGYSSMGYLLRYPTNYLKIDKEFITNIDKDEALKIVTGNLIKLGHSLSMSVIAEGVETHAELEILKEYNCDVIQGFYFSKPLPHKDFVEFVNKTGFSPLKSQIIF